MTFQVSFDPFAFRSGVCYQAREALATDSNYSQLNRPLSFGFQRVTRLALLIHTCTLAVRSNLERLNLSAHYRCLTVLLAEVAGQGQCSVLVPCIALQVKSCGLLID